jgi:hypothetical protein
LAFLQSLGAFTAIEVCQTPIKPYFYGNPHYGNPLYSREG